MKLHDWDILWSLVLKKKMVEEANPKAMDCDKIWVVKLIIKNYQMIKLDDSIIVKTILRVITKSSATYIK